MVRINLLPVKAKKRQSTVVYQLAGGAFVLFVAAGGCFAFQWWFSGTATALEAEKGKIQGEIDNYNRIIGEVTQFEAQKAELQKKLDVIGNLKSNKVGPVKLLEELATVIPKKVWLGSIRETTTPPASHSVALTGEAISDEVVAEFMTKLEESDYFSNVNLIETRLGTPRNNVPVHSFALTCEMTMPGKKTAEAAPASDPR